uniref:Uncharacterized protein n=1 Tax=Plectus sambesii TaxID=2011161 RepID=A0A914X036_9BILA
MIHRYYGLFCFSVLFVAIPTVYSCSEHNVIDAIFQNYNSRVRPVLQQNITLDIQYELRVYSIMSIDEPEEIIDLLLWTVLLWHDQFLTWNPEDFDGCTSIKVAADQIWSPDVYFINTLDVASISPTVAQYVSIFYNGSIRRALKYKAHLGCSMEINDFPFDTQNCPITVGLWTYNYSEAILNLRYPIVGLASYNGDPDFAPVMSNASEFEIVSYTGAEIMTTVGSQNYSELHYTIGLKRRPAYYVFVILIPSYMLTSLCIIGIFTPNSNINERNEKVSLGLMTLMSMTVILNIVADQMPKGSKGLPLLGIFVLYEIGICAIAIILSVIIIIIHQRSLSRGWKPPALCLWICRARVSKTARGMSQWISNLICSD